MFQPIDHQSNRTPTTWHSHASNDLTANCGTSAAQGCQADFMIAAKVVRTSREQSEVSVQVGYGDFTVLWWPEWQIMGGQEVKMW